MGIMHPAKAPTEAMEYGKPKRKPSAPAKAAKKSKPKKKGKK